MAKSTMRFSGKPADKKKAKKSRDVRGQDVGFFDVIKFKTFIAKLIWGAVITIAISVVSFIFANSYAGGSPAVPWVISILEILIGALIIALTFSLDYIHGMRLILDEDGEIISNVVGGTMVTYNDELFTMKKVTPIFYSLLGYKPGELKSKYHAEFYKLLVGEESKRQFLKQKNELRDKGFSQVQYKLRRGDDSEIWVSAKSYLYETEDFKQTVFTVLFDISDEKNLEQKFLLSEARNKIVLANINSGIFEWDLMNNTLEISDQLEQRFIGKSSGNIINASYIRDLIAPDDYEALYEKIRRMRDNEIDKIEMTIGLREPSGEYTHSDISLIGVRDNNNIIVRAVGILLDVEERHRREQQLQREASRDSLTQIYNKGATQKLVESTLELRDNQEHALVLCDMDNFKSVNDTFGHGVGDEAIKSIAVHLTSIFGNDSVVGRIGGDEFMVLCRNTENIHDELTRKLERLNSEAPVIEVGDRRKLLNLSVGVAFYPKDATTFKDLYKNADVALYRAKRSGKMRYEYFE